MKNDIICPYCHAVFNYNSHLKRHLQRKTPCSPKSFNFQEATINWCNPTAIEELQSDVYKIQKQMETLTKLVESQISIVVEAFKLFEKLKHRS